MTEYEKQFNAMAAVLTHPPRNRAERRKAERVRIRARAYTKRADARRGDGKETARNRFTRDVLKAIGLDIGAISKDADVSKAVAAVVAT